MWKLPPFWYFSFSPLSLINSLLKRHQDKEWWRILTNLNLAIHTQYECRVEKKVSKNPLNRKTNNFFFVLGKKLWESKKYKIGALDDESRGRRGRENKERKIKNYYNYPIYYIITFSLPCSRFCWLLPFERLLCSFFYTQEVFFSCWKTYKFRLKSNQMKGREYKHFSRVCFGYFFVFLCSLKLFRRLRSSSFGVFRRF